jgi:hypothetical protein
VKKYVLMLAMLSACQNTPAENEALIREAKAAISKEVGSPASAEFRNVRVAPETGAEIIGTVCGDVKAASDQIVDAPFRRFIYSKMNDLRAVEDVVDGEAGGPEAKQFQEEFDGFWNEFCV